MKILAISILSLTIISMGVGCKQAETKSDNSIDHYKSLYKMAAANGDMGVMANAIYNILLTDSTAKGWQDSLVQNMMARGLYEQAHVLAAKRIVKEPNNKILLEMEGMYAQSTGKGDNALRIYRKLYTMNAGSADACKLAASYFYTNHLDSCNMVLDKVLADVKADNQTIDMDTYDGGRQKVPVKAAALNLKGILAYKAGENKIAEAYFTEALKIFPEFSAVQQELQALHGGAGAGAAAQGGR